MKSLSGLVVIKIIFTFIFLIISGSEILNAQIIGITNRPPPAKKPPRPRPAVQPAAVRRVPVIQYKIVPTKQTGLTIFTESKAKISIKSLNPKLKFEENLEADGDGAVPLIELKPGKYKLSASLQGYQPEELEITISPQKIAPVQIPLSKITYEYTIQTNIDKGEVRYAPAEIIGNNTDGTVRVRETGGYCVVPIENKTAVIKELTEGIYNIDVSAPDDPEYQRQEIVVEVDENETRRVDLDYKHSVNTFNSTVEENWKLPAGWKMEGSVIKANGTGMALPKDPAFLFYKDFEMQSNIRLPGNASAGFVVRAKDKDNYYLIKLTGNTAEEPFRVSAIMVKNGKPSGRVLWETTRHIIEKAVNEQMFFEVVIRAKGNTFELFARDEKGALQPLGNAVFRDNNYPIGAVGIGSLENTNFEVNYFVVCNELCR
jgi:hypothetical protein